MKLHTQEENNNKNQRSLHRATGVQKVAFYFIMCSQFVQWRHLFILYPKGRVRTQYPDGPPFISLSWELAQCKRQIWNENAFGYCFKHGRRKLEAETFNTKFLPRLMKRCTMLLFPPSRSPSLFFTLKMIASHFSFLEKRMRFRNAIFRNAFRTIPDFSGGCHPIMTWCLGLSAKCEKHSVQYTAFRISMRAYNGYKVFALSLMQNSYCCESAKTKSDSQGRRISVLK